MLFLTKMKTDIFRSGAKTGIYRENQSADAGRTRIARSSVAMALQWRHNGRDGVSNHQSPILNRYSGADQRKHQSSASLAFVRGIHRWPVNSPHKGPVTRKMFPFDDVIMVLIMQDDWEPRLPRISTTSHHRDIIKKIQTYFNISPNTFSPTRVDMNTVGLIPCSRLEEDPALIDNGRTRQLAFSPWYRRNILLIIWELYMMIKFPGIRKGQWVMSVLKNRDAALFCA